MLDNYYTVVKLAEIRHQEGVAAAEHWRQAHRAAEANHRTLWMGRRWLARLGGWLESLGCALQARDPDTAPSAAGTACAD